MPGGGDAGMDGLDAMMAEFMATPKAPTTSPKPVQPNPRPGGAADGPKGPGKGKEEKKSSASTGDDWGAGGWGDEEAESPVEVKDFVRRLRAFQMRVADPGTREAINEKLAGKSAAATIKYYEERPELGEYTITTELKRMEYAVTRQNGGVTRDQTEIREIYEAGLSLSKKKE
ncbi:hypothetical protein T484DRAFT_1905615, partial [Baffinella frigidus]